MKRKLTALLLKEENMYVAQNLETGVVSQGFTIEEALGNLKEALELYLEESEEEMHYPQVVLATVEVNA